MALTDKLTAIGNAIRAKTGRSSLIPLGNMPAEIRSIETGSSQTNYEYNQINTTVKTYIQNVTYDPSDYTVSYIASYVNDTNHHRPQGLYISIPEDGTLTFQNGERCLSKAVTTGFETVYNSAPGVKAPYTVMKSDGTIVKYGVLKLTGDLRMIYLNDTKNVRDLGGWACDGGKVKYNKLFRGSRLFIGYEDGQTQTLNAYDLNVLHNLLGIQCELDLRYSNEITRDHSLIGKDVDYTQIDGAWYAISDETKCKSILDKVLDSAINNIPLYFHCAGGADRTGTLAMWIEAILGVAQSDIDKDYELTSFYSGVSSDAQARRRNESEWTGLINAFASYPGNNINDKVIAWAITLGIPVSKINAFRSAMIDGTPSAVTNPYGTVAVSKTLTHVTIDNPDQSTGMYQPYTAVLSADRGYSLSEASVTVTMGGSDITADCYSNGIISIPKVTEAISITAIGIYVNQITQAKDTIGGTALYNGTGYKQDYRWISDNTEDNVNIPGVPNKFAVGYIELEPGDVVHFYGDILKGISGSLFMHIQSSSNTRLVRATLSNWTNYTNRPDIMATMTDIDYDTTTNTLHSFKWTGGTNAVKGYMHLTCVGTFTEGVTVVTINVEM